MHDIHAGLFGFQQFNPGETMFMTLWTFMKIHEFSWTVHHQFIKVVHEKIFMKVHELFSWTVHELLRTCLWTIWWTLWTIWFPEKFLKNTWIKRFMKFHDMMNFYELLMNFHECLNVTFVSWEVLEKFMKKKYSCNFMIR